MSRFWIVLIWLAALVVDGIMLPALRIGPAGFGTLLFLIALALTFGVHRWVVGWGIAIALAAEIMLGLYFGTLIAAWLIAAWGWYGINRFFSMKAASEPGSRLAIIPLVVFGILLFVAAQLGQWFITRVFYERTLTVAVTQAIINSPPILIIVGIELLVLLAVLRLIPIKHYA